MRNIRSLVLGLVLLLAAVSARPDVDNSLCLNAKRGCLCEGELTQSAGSNLLVRRQAYALIFPMSDYPRVTLDVKKNIEDMDSKINHWFMLDGLTTDGGTAAATLVWKFSLKAAGTFFLDFDSGRLELLYSSDTPVIDQRGTELGELNFSFRSSTCGIHRVRPAPGTPVWR